ncbi:MAG TPA: glycosyltransferase family 4 protein [Pyrinomonadaceae bacterium]|nr:glycosyltransferase family 4 protein [Pyrinomonadaceae bacterium]
MAVKTLYVCYFGIQQALVQTQVLPYLRELRKEAVEVSFLTFEPEPAAEAFAQIKKDLATEGIDWSWLRYHKRPSSIATAWDIFRGAIFIRSFISRERPEILHGRVHVPTLMAALARKFSSHKPKLLFDIRGFFPEEYTDAGIWPEGGWLYRSAKRVERWLLKESDAFIVLTEKAREILFPESKETGIDRQGRPVEVIPCCVDLTRFRVESASTREELRERIGAGHRPVVVYVGSFGGWYLTDQMIDFFRTARERDPRVFVLILTQRDADKVGERLRDRGFSSTDFYVASVPPHDVPKYLAAADLAISFIKACYSKLSSSPTKIAEYLAAGLPIVANSGVGDIDALIRDNDVGFILEDFDRESYLEALPLIDSLSPELADRCRRLAEREFELTAVGGARYNQIYRRLLEKRIEQ